MFVSASYPIPPLLSAVWAPHLDEVVRVLLLPSEPGVQHRPGRLHRAFRRHSRAVLRVARDGDREQDARRGEQGRRPVCSEARDKEPE